MQLPKGFARLAVVISMAGTTAWTSVVSAQSQELQRTLAGTLDFGQIPNEFYTIPDGARALPTGFSTPTQVLAELSGQVTIPQSNFPLTRWLLHNQAPQQPVDKYVRKFHFGTWVNDPNDNSCLNTRAKVLARDSQVPVTFKPNNHCVVDTGLWNDPYTGRQFTSTHDVQIDHVVPLKHAYLTGAFRWDYKTRCLYANFLENNYHLLSVSGHENMSKGDRSPDGYMPPNPRVACGYLQAWLEIKLAWRLVIFPNEAQAIQNYIRLYRCNPNQFVMDGNELIRQRIAMNQSLPSCMKTPSLPTP